MNKETKIKNILRRFMQRSLARGESKQWFPHTWYDNTIKEINDLYTKKGAE